MHLIINRTTRTLAALCFILSGFTGQRALAQSEMPRDMRVPPRSLIEDFSIALGAAPSGGVRRIVPLAPELIMTFEGWEPSPYDDPSGYCTLGYGHLIKKSGCATIDLSAYTFPLTKVMGMELLEADTRTARVAVQRLVRQEMKDNEFGALSSFVFNVGKDNFAQSTMLKLLNEGAFNAAAKEFGKWVVSNNKVLSGLVSRRSCEAALFKNQLTPGAGGVFIRADCESLGAAPSGGDLIDIDTGKEVPLSEIKSK